MTDAEVTQLRHEIDAVMYAINSQKIEIERLTEALDGETTENMRLKHEIERLQKQENTVAKLYYLKGVRDFAKRVREDFYLTVPAVDIVNKILKDLVGETKNGEKKD